ncbi:F-box protein [Phanerochaete sordida]|uniref:F-box protein n=1 Tax=Phanerochaete sordida TaxID=48140 RepID=A0A9P3GMH4_9APHY|nr:F-box protein [Phanerochaete sordida]
MNPQPARPTTYREHHNQQTTDSHYEIPHPGAVPMEVRAAIGPDSWNSDMVLRQYLAIHREPTRADVNHGLEALRMVFTRIHVDALKDVQAQMAPREGPTFKYEMQGSLLRHKILVWRVFPINRLPAEILTMIFRAIRRSDARYGNLFAIRLTWVCRHWRQVALADPVLWGTIIFSDPYPWVRSFNYIERAGGGDLALKLIESQEPEGNGDEIAPNLTVEQVQEFLARISPKVHQLRAMIFTLDTWPATIEVLKFFSSPQARRPKSLEHFEIHRPYMANMGEHWAPRDLASPYIWNPTTLFGGEAPKLRSICISGVGIDLTNFPAANLRTLDLRYITFALCPASGEFLAVLREARNLRRLHLDSAGPGMHNPLPYVRSPAHLPRLRDLFVGGGLPDWLHWLLSHIDAPQLPCLTLAKTDLLNDDLLLPFLVGRFPALESLALYSVRYATDAKAPLLRWLSTLNSLRVFKITHCPSEVLLSWFFEDASRCRPEAERAAFAEEHPGAPSSLIMPNVSAIYFDHERLQDIIAYVNQRKQHGGPLKRAYMPFAFHVAREEEPLVKELDIELLRSSSYLKEDQDIEARWNLQFGH